MALVTRPYRSSLSKSKDGWTAVNVYEVSGVSSREEALEAAGVPQIGDSHEFQSIMKCSDVDATGGPTLWIVSARYSVPPTGDWTLAPGDPLDEPAVIAYTRTIEYIDADRDINGNAVKNLAGDVFRVTPTQPITIERISVFRNEPFYDRPKANLFSNTVNDSDVTFLGASFAKDSMLCLGIAPSEDFTTEATYLPIRYDFEARNYPDIHPHQKWERNVGAVGWFRVSGDTDPNGPLDRRGRFINGDGEPTGEIDLKRDGTPYDTTVKVLKRVNGDPGSPPESATPSPAPSSATEGVEPLEILERDGATWLIFETKRRQSFAGLI